MCIDDGNCMYLWTLMAVLLIVYLWSRHQRFRNLPPGPRPLPLLGNLLDLSSKDKLETFRKLREKYGDLVTLQVGALTMVVVSGYDTLRELFVKRDDVTSDRPDLYMFKAVANREGITTRSGPEWKIHKLFGKGALRDFGSGKKSLEGKIKEEVEVFISGIQQQPDNAKDIYPFLQTSTTNVICSIVFGKRFEYSDPIFIELTRMVREILSLVGPVGIINMFPYLRYLPGDPLSFGKYLEKSNNFREFTQKFIVDHRKDFDENNINDLIDVYLKEIKNQEGHDTSFTDFQLYRVLTELFVNGTNTIATTLLWAVLYFLHNPEIQERCHEEVKRVVGEGRFPCLSDRPQLPYIEAVIAEVLRCGNIAPIVLPHAPKQDMEFKGYVIPKGTMLIPHTNSVHFDPELFKDPVKFDPSRFIGDDGSVRGTEPVIPFFFGSRMCMGEMLSRNELFLFLTSMVQRLQFKPEDPDNLPPIKGKMNGIYEPYSYNCRVESRA